MDYLEVIVLVVSFVALLAIGVPIAYSIGLSTVITMLVSIMPMPAFTTISQRMATGLDSFALLAIPFFILAGQLMNSGGIAHRLIEFAKVLVGPIPGGLAFVNIVANMLFGAISGSAAASASAIGGFMHSRMVKEGYDASYAAAVNITSSTTGLIIPPSNVLIVYALAAGGVGVSIGALFLAGYLPGILLGLGLMAVTGTIAVRRKYPTAEPVPFRTAVVKLLDAFPSLLLLFIVIGGIVVGIFTATEASAVAVLYTFILSVFIYKEVKFKDLRGIFLSTINTTAIVMLLIATSIGMSWVMSYENIPQTVSDTLMSFGESKVTVLLIINAILLFVGIFMDMTPAVLIFTPIFLPVVMTLGLDPVHFGIMMVMNLSIGLCTPPVGSILFIGCSVGKIGIEKVIKPLIPMYIAMIAVLLIVTYVPWISMWLPRVFGF
ncbi:MAG: TRAP transporter large permease [Cyclobacteriaceae bacterium]|nr:TRAP transporter large permease [Cyclobacteriaceae bacterium]